jgi:hypothetical protein
VENAFAFSEDLVYFFEVEPVSLWEEEVYTYQRSQIFVQAAIGSSDLHGNIRKKLVQAKTRKYRHPMVEKAVGVTSATMKLRKGQQIWQSMASCDWAHLNNHALPVLIAVIGTLTMSGLISLA